MENALRNKCAVMVYDDEMGRKARELRDTNTGLAHTSVGKHCQLL